MKISYFAMNLFKLTSENLILDNEQQRFRTLIKIRFQCFKLANFIYADQFVAISHPRRTVLNLLRRCN